MVLSRSVSRLARSYASSPQSPNTGAASSTTISEALRNNPFGISSRLRSPSTRLIAAPKDEDQEQKELNNALEILARIFPDVKVEVFREMLVRFDGNSRLHVCVDQLLRHKDEWVAGRWNVPTGTPKEGEANTDHDDTPVREGQAIVPHNERFRTDAYKAAVKAILLKEFSGLSRSTVDAVLAEVNFCYMRARPTLHDLSRKTWRATFNNILPSFRSKRDRESQHPLIIWDRHVDGALTPRLRDTGCEELDLELYDALIAPLIRSSWEAREVQDRLLAEELNVEEAVAVMAMYECECCLSDVTFEQIASCSENAHIICHDCIRRTIHEALFGQGWMKSVDMERSTLKCLAPCSHDACPGSLDGDIVRTAVLQDRAGFETYSKFETRLASDALMKTQLKLIHCPFCSYAEVDSAHHPPEGGIPWRFRRFGFVSTFIIFFILLDVLPLFTFPLMILYLADPTFVPNVFRNALLNMCLKMRAKRFICMNPACQRQSCISCRKSWRDPHVCHEPMLLDLRETVEAARTAAVKRTCPRCGLSFVKASGCNKLTCVCGYSMCYLCRKGLGVLKRDGPRGLLRQHRWRPDGAALVDGQPADEGLSDDDEEPPEGYRHFCEHFRITPGRCTECTKCELYQDEDEETVARRAGEKAERDWRVRQGTSGADVATLQVNQDFYLTDWERKQRANRFPLTGPGKGWSYWMEEVWEEERWKVEAQALVDYLVEQLVEIEPF